MTEDEILNGFDITYFEMEVQTTITGCVYYDELAQVWSDYGCRVRNDFLCGLVFQFDPFQSGPKGGHFK